jgi:hypothetical protein
LKSELSSFLLMCPSHFILFIFIDLTIFDSLYNLHNSALYCTLHTPFT